MFQELRNKRLLVLGGSAWIDIIRAFANENQIQLVTVGNDPKSLLASLGEYHNIDSTDHEQMKDFIKQFDIDGVYIGSNETVIRHALEYLDELNLPHYCTLKQWDSLMNKRSFKELCIKHGIPVSPSYQWKPSEPVTFDFPVIVKPADGCASVGITICDSEERLESAYQFALDNSPSGEALIEKLVNNTGMDVFFQITDHDVEFCALGVNYPVQLKEGAGSVAGARVLPSRYTDEFRNRFEGKLNRLFKDVGLYQGLIWMEVFHDGDDYYFNEVGYRPNGSLSIIGIDYLCGINTVAADIYYALTGKGVSHGFSTLILKESIPRTKKKVCEYWVASKPGTIGSISGVNDIKAYPNVLAAFPKYSLGSVIPNTNGFAQNFCVIHFAYDDENEMRETIGFIKKTIKLTDCNGEDMIIHKSDAFVENLLANSGRI